VIYLPRIVDDELSRLVADLPAVAVDGPKAVGKSATGARLAATVIDLDLDDELELTRSNPARIQNLPAPVLVDEWQLFPQIWDKVRRWVDAGAGPGSFILTGSATPSEKPMHSGAGRIVRVRMRPMSLAERGVAQPSVSLADLLTGSIREVGGESNLTLEDYAEEIVSSGFPAIRQAPTRSRADVLNGYLSNIVEREFPEAGYLVRKPIALRNWLRAYAAATSSMTSYSSILDAATGGESDKPSQLTTVAYRETLERIWLLDELPAWTSNNPLTALARAPKHHLADPALAARMLGVNASSLLNYPNPDRPARPRQGTLFGALFESLATLCVRVYASASHAEVSYLRTTRGTHEVDLIVQREDGRILPIEVKLASTVDGKDVEHLLWLKKSLGDEVLDTVVITTGKGAYRRPDGVAVVPLGLLGA
jgi:predicted AAA+ superfamily ATPase